MKHALTLNCLIIFTVLAALVVSRQPCVLLALLMLREMPYGLMVGQERIVETEEPRIGFNAQL
jgi:hypothetical protein